VAVGAWLVLSGVLLTLDQMGLVEVRSFGRLWPLLLIALGLARLLLAREGSQSGFWLLAIGSWFALDYFLGYRVQDTWPLVIVAAGLTIVWNATVGSSRRSNSEADHV
jgi:hypothetical protein